jgi:Ca2+-binding RTX toxin-like protein
LDRDPDLPPESDTVSYASSSLGVFIDLVLQEEGKAQAMLFGGNANGDAAGDVLTGFENVIGSTKADKLVGDELDNVIEGGAGADDLDGGEFFDQIGDTLSYAGSDMPVTVNLKTGAASGGDAKGDTFVNFQDVTGSKGVDRLIGVDGDNTITGGLGADTLTGGEGSDRFVYRSFAERGDLITDFDGDAIVIHAAGFTGLQPGQDLEDGVSFFSGAGTGLPRALFNTPAFLFDEDDGKLYFDADGNGVAAPILLLRIGGEEPLLGSFELEIV